MLNWTDVISASADDLRKRGMSCILLWMQGGPSQFETFSPKPDHKNGGETKAIETSIGGIQIAENMPQCADVMQELAIIRSMTSKEGNHQRATYLLHHGYLPMGGVKFPTLGSNVADQIGNAACQLPSYVRVGGRLANAGGGGFLGVDYDPLVLGSAKRPPDNTKPTTGSDRYARRLQLLNSIQTDFAASEGTEAVADHKKLVKRAADMIGSSDMEAFDLDREPQSMRDAYGSSQFGAGCLLARRLIEHGVTFVEVASRGWDTHQDNFDRTRELTGQIDQPMAQLITDLKQRGMLDRTLVVWMGEFGRSPRINDKAVRDHWPQVYTAMLAGGGVKRGYVYGASDKNGAYPARDPVRPDDLAATMFHLLGIDPHTEEIGRAHV